MRYLMILWLPLLVQVFACIPVWFMSMRSGSFLGLFAMPVVAISLLALLVHGVLTARASTPLGGAVALAMGIALVPPVLLMIMGALIT